MKQTPLIFQPESVRSIWAGEKTQTRRIVKPQPIDDTENSGCVFSGDHKHLFKNDILHTPWQERFSSLCPYGKVGDIIWAREAHQFIQPKMFAARTFLMLTDVGVERVGDISEEDAIAEGIHSWFVPDGKPQSTTKAYKNYLGNDYFGTPIPSYRSLWDSINGKDSFSANPYVWKLTFTRIEKP